MEAGVQKLPDCQYFKAVVICCRNASSVVFKSQRFEMELFREPTTAVSASSSDQQTGYVDTVPLAIVIAIRSQSVIPMLRHESAQKYVLFVITFNYHLPMLEPLPICAADNCDYSGFISPDTVACHRVLLLRCRQRHSGSANRNLPHDVQRENRVNQCQLQHVTRSQRSDDQSGWCIRYVAGRQQPQL